MGPSRYNFESYTRGVELEQADLIQISHKQQKQLVGCTKAGGIKIRPLSEHQNYNLENVHITTSTLIKFA